jgi:hypothetical protein
VRSNSVGFQLPGGPFVQVSHTQETCNLHFHADGVHGQTILIFDASPQQMLEQADLMAELAGAMRDQANRALDFTAELQELSR